MSEDVRDDEGTPGVTAREPRRITSGQRQVACDAECSMVADKLRRKVQLYERTLGVAVLPVLARRLAIEAARRLLSAAPLRAPVPVEQESGDDNRAWIDAGPLETGRFRMFLDASSSGHGAGRMALGTYDEVFSEAIRPHDTLRGKVVWDVGAHIGYETLYFATLVGEGGHVVAFEPNPANARAWSQNMEANPALAPRVRIVTSALSDAAGVARFRFSEDVVTGLSSGSHLADVAPPEELGAYESFGVVDVMCARGDDLVETGSIPSPALVKVDVEGAEGAVLRGLAQTLRTFKPRLLVEVHHVRAMHEVDDVLGEAGYKISILDSPEESASRCFIMAE